MAQTLVPAYGIRGGNARTKMFREADTQTYIAWDFVKLVSKRVTLLVAANTNIDSTGAKVLGITSKAGRNTTNPGSTVLGVPGPAWLAADVPVWIFKQASDVEFLLPLYDSTLATNAPYSAMQPGDTCTLRNQAGIWCADVGVTSNPILQMTAKQPGILETQNNQAAWFSMIPGTTIF